MNRLGRGAAVPLTCLLAAAACSEPEPASLATVLPAVDTDRTGSPDDAVLCVDTARSLVRWRGTKVGGGSHEGMVRLDGGRLRLRDGRVTGGEFTVDMTTIAVTDIPVHEVEARRQLRSHLSHEEFFGVDRFPTARFVITRVREGRHGLHSVSGNLAVRDSVHNVTFRAAAPVLTPEAVWASADFSIDRQLWGVDFDGRTSALRDAIVHDPIRLGLTLVVRKDACGGADGTSSRPAFGLETDARPAPQAPGNADEVVRGFPNGRHLVIENAGHSDPLPTLRIRVPPPELHSGRLPPKLGPEVVERVVGACERSEGDVWRIVRQETVGSLDAEGNETGRSAGGRPRATTGS